MRFNEIHGKAQDATNDEVGKWDIDDTRRPRFTLKHLHKMNNLRELETAQHAKEVAQAKVQYGANTEDGTDAGPEL